MRRIPNPNMQDFARHLLAYESAAGDSSAADVPVVVRVSEKLRRPLCVLAGASGFRSLLTRALTLAKSEAPVLGDVSVNPDGSLDGLNGLHSSEALDAGVALITQLLSLLASFIGEPLALSLVHEAWPELPMDDASSGNRTNDPTK